MNIREWSKFDALHPNLVDVAKIRSLTPGAVVVDGSTPRVGVVRGHVEAVSYLVEWHDLDEGKDWNGQPVVRDKPKIKIRSIALLRQLVDRDATTITAYGKLVSSIVDERRAAQRSLMHERLRPFRSMRIGRPADLTEMRQLDLCPQVAGSVLVWKCLRTAKDDELDAEAWYGNLGAPYRVGTTYSYPLAMACAGPIGAITGYGGYGPLYVGALLVRDVLYAELDNAYYVPNGSLASVYRLDSVTRHFDGDVDITTTLVAGTDSMSLINAD